MKCCCIERITNYDTPQANETFVQLEPYLELFKIFLSLADVAEDLSKMDDEFQMLDVSMRGHCSVTRKRSA